jgi:PadR family transcriptional regulator, regulatory protein PadR
MRKDEIPPGALELLILTTLSKDQELHGFEIVDAIERTSGKVFNVPEGSLYPALQRMLLKGWVTGKWGVTDGSRRARYYRITKTGRRKLQDEVHEFERVYSAIQRVIAAV